MTSITRDGTMNGPDLDILNSILKINIPLVICGGIDVNKDINKIENKMFENDNLSGFASSSSYLF